MREHHFGTRSSWEENWKDLKTLPLEARRPPNTISLFRNKQRSRKDTLLLYLLIVLLENCYKG